MNKYFNRNIPLLIFFPIVFLSILTDSCVSTKKIVYFKNQNDTTNLSSQAITENYEPTIQPDDILAIAVSSISGMENPTIVQLFNMPNTSIPTYNSAPGVSSNLQVGGYLVDKEGNIDFPVIGKINISGETPDNAKDSLQVKLKNYLKDPIVNIRFINFKITVLGEVNRPSTYVMPNEKVTVLDALGMAGDMTIFGKRDNVLIIREENGRREFAHLDINSRDIFNSNFFYLHQGDVVYVEPSRAKISLNNPINTYYPIIFGILSLLTIIAYQVKIL
jgi:polysaccharide export outer membrane protein